MYVVLAVFVGSSFHMSYITYSRRNITETDLHYFLLEDNMVEVSKHAVTVEDEYDAKKFFSHYIRYGKPVVYKGFANTWPALEKWNIWETYHLGSKFGNTPFALDKLPIADDGTNQYSEYKEEKLRHSVSDFTRMQYVINKILD